MASCNGCEDLRRDAPAIFVNGITDTETTSLENNTGLNPSSGNDDCTDLNNMNDCFIGSMDSEVDSYDVCEWKDYIKMFIPNLWTTLKGIIAAICGLWKHIDGLEDSQGDMCKLIEATLQHPVKQYGIMNNGGTAAQQGGTIASKNGKPILTPLARTEVASDEAWAMQNVGFRYGKLTVNDCNGACKRHEWIAPDIYAYRFNPEVVPAYGDLLWSIDKASVTGRMGMTTDMWSIRHDNPITWATDFSVLRHAMIAIRMSVENDRLCLRYYGAIGDSDAHLTGQTIIPPADQAERLYKFSC